MYRVLTVFADIEDHDHVYHPGDTYPRDGVEVSAPRLEYLASSNTRLGKPVIEKIAVKRTRKTEK